MITGLMCIPMVRADACISSFAQGAGSSKFLKFDMYIYEFNKKLTNYNWLCFLAVCENFDQDKK